MTRFSFFFLLIIVLSACNNESTTTENKPQGDPEKDLSLCEKGVPKAIFTEDMEEVLEHSFQVDKAQTTEITKLKNCEVILIQSGCEQWKQEFIFTIPEVIVNDESEVWVDKSVEIFRYLSQVDSSLFLFNEWANALSTSSDRIQLGRPTELTEGGFVLIDKKSNIDNSFIAVEFRSGLY